MSTKKSIQKFVGVVVLLALVFGAVAVNFTRSASTSVAPAIMSMEGGVAAAGPVVPGSDKPETAVIPLAGSSDVDLRDLPQTGNPNKKLMPEMVGPQDKSVGTEAAADSVVQAPVSVAAMPVLINQFAGMDLTNWGAGWPPDTHGAVGPSHYVQAVNTSMAVYSKTGTRLAAFTLDDFMGGTAGSACDAYNMGDPIVLYDHYSGRWIVTDFAWTTTRGPFYECFAISKTEDPVSGGWWFYQFQVDSLSLGDYPKLGVWPDGVYMGASLFKRARTYAGARVWVFNRADMISGAPMRTVSFSLGTSYFSVFPSTTASKGGVPPTGTPNYFFSDYGLTTGVRMWKFHVDWANTAASTFTGPTTISVASFSKPANSYVPQPGTTMKLDTLGDRLMSNFEYRNLNGAESIWLTRTVLNGSLTGIRWMELRGMSGTPAVYQQGTFAPADTLYRFMPSLSVDKVGNMAVGYSVSSSSVYPSIRYAGRLVTDALGQLGQGEASIITGSGSQTNYSRWGDYSSMTIDPDGCTFWYTTEYYATTGSNWQTRIASFKYPNCTP